MKKDRRELETYLLKQCERIATRPEQYEKIRKELFEKYDIPTGKTMDMIARGKLSEQTEHILFCLLSGMEEFVDEKNVVEKFFTSVEVTKYSKTKMPKNKMRFPIVIKCNQVTDDQWIGVTDTNFFMALREMQLINYNENAQRTLTKIITSNGEYYKITIDEKTVQGIRACLQRGEYIPTPITLNIPLEVNSDFYYDEEQGALIINSLPYFDISDGYHRYVAMSREKDVNPNFNCNWELRIVNFSEDKARYFIYQEDLKTKMKKINSRALNSYSQANRVTSMLNQDPSFGLFGQINSTDGKINNAEFSKIVDAFYFKNKEYADENESVKNVKNELRNKINYLLEISDKYNKKYTYVELIILLYVLSREEDLNRLDTYISGMISNVNKINQTKLQPARAITKSLTKVLDQLFEEVR